jgi:hypothetical protein
VIKNDFIGKKIMITQKLNSHHCKEQLKKFFFIPYENSVYAHHDDIVAPKTSKCLYQLGACLHVTYLSMTN